MVIISAGEYFRRPHLSTLALLPLALGRNVLPLLAATTAGGAWILWLDRRAWARTGHPLLGWTGARLALIDVAVHWAPLALCVWWTVRGRAVDVWLSLALAAAYLAVVGGPRGIVREYGVENGHAPLALAIAGFCLAVAGGV